MYHGDRGERMSDWVKSMAKELAQAYPDGLPASTYEAVLATAQEMGCVKLKVLLARCREILVKHSEDEDCPYKVADEFIDKLDEAIG